MSGADFARSLISALGVRHADLYLDKVGPAVESRERRPKVAKLCISHVSPAGTGAQEHNENHCHVFTRVLAVRQCQETLMPDAQTLCSDLAQVDDMPAELQSARVKFAEFMLLAKLRWSSQQLVAAMRLFHQATGQFGRENLQVLAGRVHTWSRSRWRGFAKAAA
jgi:hypothetical protein